MSSRLKKRLYFMVAAYFAFWAKLVLRRWRPRIIVITGSSGKTTVLHLVEAQLGKSAIYSHHANSAIGLQFFILGMNPNVLKRWQWFTRVFSAPLRVWRRLPSTKLFVAEADCDRPHEGEFLSQLLKPEVTMWVSVYRTHSMNFDKLVKSGEFKTHEAAIAHEFGNFVAQTTKLVLTSDQPVITAELSRAPDGVEVKQLSLKALSAYQLAPKETIFRFGQQTIHVSGLHPRALGVSLQMVNALLDYLAVPLDITYQKLDVPPGRSRVFTGQKNTVLIDSTYNTSYGATEAVLALLHDYPAPHRWLVLGDILEQGSLEQEEHEKLASLVAQTKFDQVVLVGRRTAAHTYVKLQAAKVPVVSFEQAGEVLGYLQQHLQGGEVILFKGAQGLEGVIEQLLANPADAQHLVRREPVWVKRRQAWGLPR